MLTSTDKERDEVTDYYLSQSPKASVSFAQKVYAETIIGHRHEVWDVHASDGRWWIVTSPMMLYSQDQFPNMDLVVTFHMGFCLRVPRTDKKLINETDIIPITDTFHQHEEVEVALTQADSLLAYRAVGVGCRETLISYIQSLMEAAEWPQNEFKKSDVKNWAQLMLSVILEGPSNEKRRRLFRTTINEAWDFSNWLTHTSSATWHDAEAAYMQVSHVLNMTTSLMLRYLKKVPEACPECGSPHLSPESGYNTAAPEIEWQRPVCDDCSWTGEPVPLRERSADEMIVREGAKSDGCSIMENPIMGLKQPSSD